VDPVDPDSDPQHWFILLEFRLRLYTGAYFMLVLAFATWIRFAASFGLRKHLMTIKFLLNMVAKRNYPWQCAGEPGRAG